MGDWKTGEKLAQSGYGLRFTDYPARQANGGNCYACHQLTKAEVSYGTLGPSLLNTARLRNFSEADTKAVYEKIYNAQAAFPCSNMPRFGANKVLTIDQIKDLVALVMSPDSPVNKKLTETSHADHATRNFGALAVSGATLAHRRRSPRPAARPHAVKKDTDIACLYHCDFGDPQRFSQLLQNMTTTTRPTNSTPSS